MKHLIVIQCHKYRPAVKLGRLLEKINSSGKLDLQVLYAFDEITKDRDKFIKLPNSKGFRIGYFTVDQGLFHLNLLRYLYTEYDKEFDYMHVVSESDLPTLGIFRIDDILKDKDAYGYYHLVNSNGKSLYKAIAWYGLSKYTVDILSGIYRNLIWSFMDDWVTYSNSDHIASGFTGSFDEYSLGRLLSLLPKVLNKYSILFDSLRLVLWSDSDKKSIIGCDYKVNEFGELADNRTSPITLLSTEKTIEAVKTWNVLFARKFEYNSESYKYFYKLIKDEIKL